MEATPTLLGYLVINTLAYSLGLVAMLSYSWLALTASKLSNAFEF